MSFQFNVNTFTENPIETIKNVDNSKVKNKYEKLENYLIQYFERGIINEKKRDLRAETNDFFNRGAIACRPRFTSSRDARLEEAKKANRTLANGLFQSPKKKQKEAAFPPAGDKTMTKHRYPLNC